MSAAADDADEPTEEELEDGEERCPVCGKVNTPGAMQFCPHYLWTIWDTQLMWEIGPASDLLEAASAFCSLVHGADESDELDTAISKLRDAGHKRLAEISKFPDELTPGLLLENDALLYGEYNDTDGMLSGAGQSVYAPRPAAEWIASELASLQSALAEIERN